ncbi:MAG: extracellular solute-binding protein family 1 [Paenibacillaceae bacterium]|nr:extracellular solute-binding protein family 1 [Paenibacillaceae bacterium]
MQVRKRFRLFTCLALISLLFAAAGCSNGEKTQATSGNPGNQQATTDQIENGNPLELIFYSHKLGDLDNYFENIYLAAVQKKYPNVSIKFMIGKEGTSPMLDELLATGVNPDILYVGSVNVPQMRDEYKAAEDLAPYIKSAKMDLNQFEPVVMKELKSYGPKGEIFALPIVISPYALYFNKDLFDKFGVAYPKDGMTWDQTTELAKKLTRTEGGVQYKGIVLQHIRKESVQLSLPFVDSKTMKPAFESDGWKRLFTEMKKVYANAAIPIGKNELNAYKTQFSPDKTAAMLPNNNKLPSYAALEKDGFNWDLVQWPYYADRPNIGPSMETNVLMLNKAGKHKEAAFKVISYLLSDDVLTPLAQSTLMPANTDPKYKQAFGANYPTLKNKNLQAMFKTIPADQPFVTPYDDLGLKALEKAWTDVLENNVDINSALRQASEQFGQQMAAQNTK